MVENGGEITAPISISLEFQMRSDSSLSLSFFPFIVTQTIIKYKNINNLSRHQRLYFKAENATMQIFEF